VLGCTFKIGCAKVVVVFYLTEKTGLFDRVLNVLLSTQPVYPPAFALSQSSSVPPEDPMWTVWFL
jgi:hypothetical protein